MMEAGFFCKRRKNVRLYTLFLKRVHSPMDKGFICIKHDGFILKSAFFGNSPFLERTLKGTKLKTERKTKKVELVSSVSKN